MSVDRLKSLGKDILWYGLSNMLYTLVQLLAMPIVIRQMSMEEVANWNIFLPTGVLLSAIVTFGMDSAIVRFVIDKDEKFKKQIFSTGLFFVLSVTLILGLFLLFGSSLVLKVIKFSYEYLACYWILLLWLPGVLLAQFFQNWLKYSFQRSKFISVIVCQSSTYLLAIFYLKYTGQISLLNVMIASLLSVWFAATLGLFYTRTMINFTFNSKLLIQMLRYGSPFMILAFGYNLIFSIDKFLLAGRISPDDFAIYSQSFRIAGIFSMLISSFNFAFGPFSLSLMNKEDGPEAFACLRTVYLLVMCISGVIFISFDKAALFILAGPQFIQGYSFIPYFVFGYIFYGLYSFAQIGMIHSKNTHLSLYVLICGLIITVCFDYFSIPYLYGLGTALGFGLGNYVMVSVASYFSNKYYIINSTKFKELLIVGIFIFCGFTNTCLFSFDNVFLDGIFRCSLYLLIFSFMFFIPLFQNERKLFIQIFSKK